ncbi:hypothetical protein D3C76_374150 [compost metagenome]
MEQRQRRDHHVVTVGVKHVGKKRPRLHDVGDEVAVGQRSAFRGAGGPAGVLQKEQVIARQFDRCQLQHTALVQGIGETRHRKCRR